MDTPVAQDKSFEVFLRDIGVTNALVETSYGDTTWDARFIIAGEVDQAIIERYSDGSKLPLAVSTAEWSVATEWSQRTDSIFVVIDGKKQLLDTVLWHPWTEDFIVSVRWNYPYGTDTRRMTVTELRAAIGGKDGILQPGQRMRSLESQGGLRNMRKLFQRLTIKD